MIGSAAAATTENHAATRGASDEDRFGLISLPEHFVRRGEAAHSPLPAALYLFCSGPCAAAM